MRILLLFSSIFLFHVVSSEKNSLVFATSIWRHADRAPARRFSSEDTKHNPLFKNGLGQLTDLGIAHAYGLGEYIKQAYMNNGAIFAPDQVKVQSTIHERTQRTAKEVLRAMFGNGPQPEVMVGSEANWFLKPSPNKCPVIVEIQNRKCNGHVHLPNYTQFEDYELDLWMCTGTYKHAKHFTTDKESFMEMESILNEHLSGYVFPPSSGVTQEKIEEADKMYRLIQRITLGIGEFHEPYILKVYSGEMLNRTFSEMKHRVECTRNNNCDQLKFQGYSSQDLQVFPMLEIMNSTAAAVGASAPLYTSAIFFELHQIENEFFVKLLYRRDHLNDVIDITPNVPNCEGNSPCAYEKFISCCDFYLSRSNKFTCSKLDDIRERLAWISGHTVDGIVEEEPKDTRSSTSLLNSCIVLNTVFLIFFISE